MWPKQVKPLPAARPHGAHARRAAQLRHHACPAWRRLAPAAGRVEAGKRLVSRAICAPTDGHTMPRHPALRSRYGPALIQRQPVTGVATLIVPFAGGAR